MGVNIHTRRKGNLCKCQVLLKDGSRTTVNLGRGYHASANGEVYQREENLITDCIIRKRVQLSKVKDSMGIHERTEPLSAVSHMIYINNELLKVFQLECLSAGNAINMMVD